MLFTNVPPSPEFLCFLVLQFLMDSWIVVPPESLIMAAPMWTPLAPMSLSVLLSLPPPCLCLALSLFPCLSLSLSTQPVASDGRPPLSQVLYRGFCLLKGSFSSPLLPSACSCGNCCQLLGSNSFSCRVY